MLRFAVLLLLSSCWTAQNTPQAEPEPAVETAIPAECKPATHSRAGDVELTTCSIAHGDESEWRAYLVQAGRADSIDEPNARAVALVGALANGPVAFVKATATDGREVMQTWLLAGAPKLGATFDGKTADVVIDGRGAVVKTCDDSCTTKTVRWVDGALVVDAQ